MGEGKVEMRRWVRAYTILSSAMRPIISREGSSYLYLVEQKDVYNLLSELSLLKLGKKKKIPTRRDYECKRSHEAHDIGLVIEKETLL